MNVLMATRWPVGGIRTFLRYMYTQPPLSDCRVLLLVPQPELAEELDSYLPESIFTVKATSSGGFGLCQAMRRELRDGRFDLLHSHGLTAGVIAQFARAGLRVPHVLTVHDVFLPTMFRGLRGRLTRLALNRVIGSVDAVHAVGEDCAANFREYVSSVPSRQVHAIPSGIDTARFAEARSIDLRGECDLTPDTGLIGFFGRFMAPKGFRTLVDAVGLLVQRGLTRPLKVVTFGWGGFIREDYQYLADRGLGEYFLQHPHTDEPERWMKGLDVVAMPSRWEACGLLAMEALTAGVPIVGTSCIGLREVLCGSPARTVAPGDSEGLAVLLHDELEQPRHEEFCAYAKIAEQRFSAAASAQRLRSLYEDLRSSGAMVV